MFVTPVRVEQFIVGAPEKVMTLKKEKKLRQIDEDFNQYDSKTNGYES